MVSEGGRDYRVFMAGKSTRTFYVGPIEEMRKLGLSGTEKSRARGRAKPVLEEQPDSSDFHPIETEEIEAPPAVEAALTEAVVLDSTEAPSSPSEAESQASEEHRRRRRRRGGRGRGRRRTGASTDAGDAAPEA